MDGTKTGRRRVHYEEFDEVNHLKRKLHNGTTRGGATTRPNIVPDHVALNQFGGRARTGNMQSSSTLMLPSSLKESERMLFVQRWINKIPVDLPLWVQTSVNKIVPMTNTLSYPVEDINSNSDCKNSMSTAIQAYVPHSTSNSHRLPIRNVSANISQSSSHPYSVTIATVSAGVGAGATATTMGVLGPRFPNTGSGGGVTTNMANTTLIQQKQHSQLHHHHHHLYYNDGDACDPDHHLRTHLDYPHPYSNQNDGALNTNGGYDSNPRIGGVGDCSHAVGRLFDDVEIQMIVKLFRDYFTKGSCPILKEVRHRMMNTVLESKRTAVGIRAKIKRLQKSGRWTDYTGI